MIRRKGAAYTRQDASALFRQLLFDTEQTGIVFMALDGTIRGWNHGAHFITGFTEDDVLGRKSALLFTPEDRERKLDEHELETALVVGFAHDDRWHMRKDGLRFWSSGVCLPLKNRRGKVTGFVKSYRDMTNLRTRIKYLENAVQEYAAQVAQRDIYLGTVAHELRNPLSPVKSATHVLHQLASSSALEKPVELISRQVGVLERLVEDLVDLTRAKTGKLGIVYEEAEMQQIVAHAVDAVHAAAVSKSIDLHMAVPSVPILLELDAGRMQQVFVNLLNNAIKFTQPGGKVWVTATVDQTHALILVKDSGIGIAPDLLPGIFDMFTQAPQAESQRGSGLGIGLALVKQVVELHQGTVEVRSEGEGKGSEFSVRIPQRRPEGSEPEPRSP